MKLLVATRNRKKLIELDRILRSEGIENIELLSLADVDEFPERPEDGRTFIDNAFIKAVDGAAHTGLMCVADDSGLSVDALGGMPGVLSARWAGVHGDDVANYQLMLAQIADAPDERRGAAFRSACALVVPASESGADAEMLLGKLCGAGFEAELDADGNLRLAVEGRWPGKVLRAPIGDNGFGYDPVFAPDEFDGLSAAQLTAEQKDSVSHRGRALRALAPALRILAGE